MDWKDLESVIGKAAPIVGGLLGGPMGAAAGGLVAGWLGVENTPDAVNNALAADPQAFATVQTAAINAQVELQKLVVTAAQNQMVNDQAMYATEVDDRKDARKRQADMHDPFPNWMAALVTSGFFGLIVLLATYPIPEQNKAVLYLLLGSLGTAWTGIIAYIYGSTRQSASQTAKITDFAVSPGSVTIHPIEMPANTKGLK